MQVTAFGAIYYIFQFYTSRVFKFSLFNTEWDEQASPRQLHVCTAFGCGLPSIRSQSVAAQYNCAVIYTLHLFPYF